MNLNEMFPCSASGWVRYNSYEYRDFDGIPRIMPSNGAVPEVYNPMEQAVEMLTDALNIGRLCRFEPQRADGELLRFAEGYGLLGLAVDFPTNPDFTSSMEPTLTGASRSYSPLKPGMTLSMYMSEFFSMDFKFDSDGVLGDITNRSDTYNLIFSASYGERKEWLIQYFSSLYDSFEAISSNDAPMDVRPRNIRYEIRGKNPPRLNWIFPSIKSVMDMAFAQCICVEEPALRLCKSCGKIYYSENSRSGFCSTRCRNRHNVRAFRSRKKAGV